MSIILKIKEKINYIFDKSGNKQIVHLTYFFTGLLLALITYISLFVVRNSDEVINNSYNKRESLYEQYTYRGDILSSDGEVLAYSDINNSEKRVYPFGNIFAHVVGFNKKGKQGIESLANFRLLTSNIDYSEKFSNELSGIKNPGDSIVTSLNIKSQIAAYEALGNRKGAVIFMDAANGYILAMVSKPDFDPNYIDFNWENIINDKDNSILLNRAMQGLYPPGSTFKILTALEYIKENPNTDNYEFDCNGFFEYKGTRINCYHGASHGNVDFKKSFAKSCNSSFANITTKLNKNSFKDTCEELLFNQELPSPALLYKRSSMNVYDSYVPINNKSSIDELMQTGIGQGKTSVTPYHMCLISAAIANDGVLMNPIIVKEIETAAGDHVKGAIVRPYKRLISLEDSVKLKELMRDVVTSGTGTCLYDTSGYIAYGKTGSAEYTSDKAKSHAWFTGFAEGENGALVSISVIIEDGGSGGQVAAPVAKRVFDAYFN